MNEKKAREIVEKIPPQKSNIRLPDYKQGSMEIREFAKGYLEAIEKANVLANTLNKVFDFENSQYKVCISDGIYMIEEALTKWEKEK